MRQLKISTRIVLGYLVITLAFLGLAGIAVILVQSVSRSAAQMEAQSALLHQADLWQANVRQNSARSLAVAYSDGGAMLELFQADIRTVTEQTSVIQQAFQAGAQDAATRQRLADVVAVRTAWVAVRDKANALKAAGEGAAAKALVVGTLVPQTADYIRTTQALVDGQMAQVQAARQAIEADFQRLYAWGAVLLGCCIAVAAFSSWSLARGISRGLAATMEAADHIGEGDLSRPIATQGHDELANMARSLASMQGNLTRVVTHVRQASESVANASAEIAQGNNDLSARTEQQAGALESIASSMAELDAAVRHNAESARQANQVARDASALAQRGGEAVDQVVQTMHGINEASRKIADITGVIDGIAFQTNILALNAAVEAARAGEQGRGFAVVASEVRSLAGRSAEAAKEIKGLINDSVVRVEQGSALVEQAGTTMAEVVGATQRVSDLMERISAASSEQSADVAQIGRSVQAMDQSTQQNSALVEQMAAAASGLKMQAQEMVDVVAVFHLAEPQGAESPAAQAA